MSHPVNDQILDDLRDKRQEFMQEWEIDEDDLLTDEHGREYINVLENFEAQEYRKEYLPSIEDYQRPEGEE